MKRLIIFDLDGTLAQSKSAIDAEMADLLHALLGVARVAVISGGDWSQFQTQMVANLPADDRLRKLSLLPTCGAQFFQYKENWSQLYAEDLRADEKQKIIGALERARSEADAEPPKTWGKVIEDRGSQITFSALGQQAPLEAKARWDPDFVKRKRMKAVLDQLIPELSVRLGGTTSIDVTKLGIDKAYGIRKLRDVLGISVQEMLFIGDALFVGGNDYPAREAGVACIQVRDPEETMRIIETILACLERPASARESQS